MGPCRLVKLSAICSCAAVYDRQREGFHADISGVIMVGGRLFGNRLGIEGGPSARVSRCFFLRSSVSLHMAAIHGDYRECHDCLQLQGSVTTRNEFRTFNCSASQLYSGLRLR